MQLSKTKTYPGVFLAALSGLLLFLSAPGPFGFGPVSFIALIPLLIALRGASLRRSFLYGLLSGIIYYPLMLYWIVIVLGRYGYLPWYISVPAMLLLAFYMSLYPALFSLCLAIARRHTPLIWAAPIIWVSLDLIRSFLFSGFPWQDLGYSLYNFPILIQISDLFGHYGVTFWIVMIHVFLLTIFLRLKNASPSWQSLALDRASLVALAVILLAGGYNISRYSHIDSQLKNKEMIDVAVLQGNIAQGQKWNIAFRDRTIEIYTELSRAVLKNHDNGIIIWPETALPFFPLESPQLDKKIAAILKNKSTYLLTGAPHRSRPFANKSQRYYNSAFLFAPNGTIISRYDKQHLVPFGEYVPLRKILFFLGPLVETIGDFSKGFLTQPLTCRNAKIGVLICFESIFPELARQQVNKGANMLTNITNDAWFGRSSAPLQHLSMAVFRAVENRRSLARAANTGISGFITPRGTFIKQSALFEPAALSAHIPLNNEKTIFSFYGGHYFATICLFLTFLMVIIGCRVTKKQPH